MSTNDDPGPKTFPKDRSNLAFIWRTCSQYGITNGVKTDILVISLIYNEARRLYIHPANSKTFRSICLAIIREKARKHLGLLQPPTKPTYLRPIQEYEILEETAKVCVAFKHLSPEQKNLLYCREILDLSEQEISTQLDLNEAAVVEGIDKARQELRKAFHCVAAE